jgi:hypothetical protein
VDIFPIIKREDAHMPKPFHRVHVIDMQKSVGEHLPLPVIKEEVDVEQVEFEIWEQHVRRDARSEAAKKGGPLALGSIEAQLKRISEEVTRRAQEKNKRDTSSRQSE